MVPWVMGGIGFPAGSFLMNSSMILWVYIAMLIAGCPLIEVEPGLD